MADFERMVRAAEVAEEEASRRFLQDSDAAAAAMVSNVQARDSPAFCCLLCGTGVRDARALFTCRCELVFHVACMRIHMRESRSCPCCRREVRTIPPPDAIERMLYGAGPKRAERTGAKRAEKP